MKTVFSKQLLLALALPLFAASVNMPFPSVVHAEEAVKPAKTPRAKARVSSGSVTQATATSLKLDTQEGAQDITLTNKTDIARLETGLSASDLKVGDTLALVLAGTSGRPTVQSLTPLTLQFDNASVTFSNTGKTKFSRYTKLSATDLVAGQQVKVTATPRPDGTAVARNVYVTSVNVEKDDDKEE